jgi:DNA-binding NtrC family response regulator
MKPMTILVADDEENIRVLMQHWLKGAGHTVEIVSNAIEGCATLPKTKFDLVITDVLMPDGDGLHLIREIKRVSPHTRVLAMSGGGRYMHGEDYLKMARGLGAHAIVTKPFTWQELTVGIEMALAPLPERK